MTSKNRTRHHTFYGAIDFVATGELVPPAGSPVPIQLHVPRSWAAAGVAESLVMTPLSPAASRLIGDYEGAVFQLRLGGVAVRARRYGNALPQSDYAFVDAGDVLKALATAMAKQVATRTKLLGDIGVRIDG
jgi:hypothetical protein